MVKTIHSLTLNKQQQAFLFKEKKCVWSLANFKRIQYHISYRYRLRLISSVGSVSLENTDEPHQVPCHCRDVWHQTGGRWGSSQVRRGQGSGLGERALKPTGRGARGVLPVSDTGGGCRRWAEAVVCPRRHARRAPRALTLPALEMTPRGVPVPRSL